MNFIMGRGKPTFANRGLRRANVPGALTVDGLERKLGTQRSHGNHLHAWILPVYFCSNFSPLCRISKFGNAR